MRRNTPLSFWQTILALSLSISLIVLSLSLLRCWQIGVFLPRSVWSVALVAYLIACLGSLAGIRFIHSGKMMEFLEFLEFSSLRGARWRLLAGLIFVGVIVLVPWLKITFQFGEQVRQSTRDPLLSLLLYYWIVWWLILLAAGALKIAAQTSWAWTFAGAVVFLGVCYEIFVRLQAVTGYPFSLGWSETSRYYYASLYFSEHIYGQRVPLSTLHPSRYLLQSLAFLVPGAGLTWHRAWQFLLWICLSAGSSVALARRLWQSQRQMGWLFAGWFFVFVLRIGVYYHLQVMTLIIFLLVSRRHPWRSLFAVLLASVWAGLSRVNWLPVPAMLAISIYFLEQPLVVDAVASEKKSQVKALVGYLKYPLIWGIAGCTTALLAQLAYIPLSGNSHNAQAFTSSFTSSLIWRRLWPNESFALGILPAILLITSPLMLVIFYALRHHIHKMHWFRLAGLFSMVAVLFAGGLVVSTKIGGGADLHNMDAYAMLLGVIAAYFLFQKARGESEDADWGVPPWHVRAIALLVPLAFLLPALHLLPEYNLQRHERMLEGLKRQVETYAQKGPVLFISERHLLTFNNINIPLVPDYENVTLMEMAMSGNTAYLNRFYADLKEQRFAAIVAGKQNRVIMTTGAFAEENNVWNTVISPYILCYYKEAVTIPAKRGKILIYTPRRVPVCP